MIDVEFPHMAVLPVAAMGALRNDKGLAGAAAVVKKGAAASYGKDWCAIKGKKDQAQRGFDADAQEYLDVAKHLAS